jgi:hypothetical protein
MSDTGGQCAYLSGEASNGCASAEEFRFAASRRNDPESVRLPKSGLCVKLRRPSPLWLLLHGLLPASLAVRLEGRETRITSPDDLRALADWMVPLLQEVFVQPRLCIEPGPGEISPDLLELEDASFVIRWAVGEVAAVDSDLVPFCGK